MQVPISTSGHSANAYRAGLHSRPPWPRDVPTRHKTSHVNDRSGHFSPPRAPPGCRSAELRPLYNAQPPPNMTTKMDFFLRTGAECSRAPARDGLRRVPPTGPPRLAARSVGAQGIHHKPFRDNDLATHSRSPRSGAQLQLAVVAGSRAPVSGTDWPSLGTSGPHVSSRSPRSCIDSWRRPRP